MPGLEPPSPYGIVRDLVKKNPDLTAPQIASLATSKKMDPEATFDQLLELAAQAGAKPA